MKQSPLSRAHALNGALAISLTCRLPVSEETRYNVAGLLDFASTVSDTSGPTSDEEPDSAFTIS